MISQPGNIVGQQMEAFKSGRFQVNERYSIVGGEMLICHPLINPQLGLPKNFVNPPTATNGDNGDVNAIPGMSLRARNHPRFGNCMVPRFDGSSAALNVNATRFSETMVMSAWFRTTSTSGLTRYIVSYSDQNDSDPILGLRVSGSDKAGLLYRDNGTTGTAAINSSASVNDGKWHHIVGANLSDTYREMWLDGVFIGSDTTSLPGGMGGVDRVRIGCLNYNSLGNDFYFDDGEICDVRVWRGQEIQLTEAFVQELYWHPERIARPTYRTTYSFPSPIPEALSHGVWTFPSLVLEPRHVNHQQPVNWQHPLTRGLVGWWKVLPDWRGGNTFRDLLEKIHGTLTNMDSSAWVAGPRNSYGSLSFNGTSSYVNLGPGVRDMGGSSSDNPISFAAWVYVNSLANPVPFVSTNTAGSDTTDTFYFGIPSSDELFMGFYDDNGSNRIVLQSNSPVNANEWMHVAATYSGNKSSSGITLFINGMEVAGSDNSAGTYNGVDIGSKDWFIGARWLGGPLFRYADAQIDDVRIYNRVLSAGEVFNLYNLSSQQHSPLLNYLPASAVFGTRPAALETNPQLHISTR